MIVYFTNSSIQSTRRSLLPLGMSLLPPSSAVSSVNCVYAFGMELWLGMVNMRIHRPRIRSELTVLKDWEPPDTWAIARVRPCVGRTEPVDSGIQSIWFLKTAVYTGTKLVFWHVNGWPRDSGDFHAVQATPRHVRHSICSGF